MPAPVAAEVFTLAGDAVLVTWERTGQAAERLLARLGDRPAPRPHSILSLALGDDRARVIAALSWPAFERAGRTLSFIDGAGAVLAEARLPEPLGAPPVDPAGLLEGLGPEDRVRATRLLLDFCAGSLKLGRDPAFAAAAWRLAFALAPRPSRLIVRAAVAGRFLIAEGSLPAEFGEASAVFLIGAGQVRRNPFLPHRSMRAGKPACHLVLEAPAGQASWLAVIAGRGSLAVRRLDAPAEGEGATLLAFLERAKGLPMPVREHLAACLAGVARRDGRIAATLEEMQLCLPLPARALPESKTRPFAAGIRVAVGAGAGGLFVSGWLADPHGLIEGIRAVSAFGGVRPLAGPFSRFPRDAKAGHHDRTGFAAFAPGDIDPVPSRQHRFELLLRSGAVIDLVAPPQPADPAGARAAVLAAVPPAFADESALAEVIGPPAAALHAAIQARRGPPAVERIGPPPARPRLSVIIPLYKTLDFIRFQMAAFATDPAFAGLEIVYVLDSPEQHAEVAHLLKGLHRLYGLPVTLAVQPANFGYSAANNAGVAAARGRVLVLLNSDVVPDAPGWTALLEEALSGEGIGAVGPKLLFDDDSLQHAGMFFGRDVGGRWINQHFFKGYPRDFAPACRRRRVPAVTGACLVVGRALFEEVGGFSEDYIIGDYEDSDLCLKIRRAGREILYAPEAELYHLERQSITRHEDYARGTAALYNAWLHARRWGEVMEALMAPAAVPMAAAG